MIKDRITESQNNLVGLVPAAGKASRLPPLPLSKEIFPIIFQDSDKPDSALRPKGVCVYLLEKMRSAGAHEIYIVLRKGKWDIPAYLVSIAMHHMSIAYLVTEATSGVPYTLDTAFPFIKDKTVLFGFPDILFKTDNPFKKLLPRIDETSADLVLGLFQVTNAHKWDMVELIGTKITKIKIKPTQTNLMYTWVIAVWTPVFTHFMHDYLSRIEGPRESFRAEERSPEPLELSMSELVQNAIDDGLRVEGVILPSSFCLDIGTRADLAKAVRYQV